MKLDTAGCGRYIRTNKKGGVGGGRMKINQTGYSRGVAVQKREWQWCGRGVAGVWQGCDMECSRGCRRFASPDGHSLCQFSALLHVTCLFTSLLLMIDLFHYMFIIKSHFQSILVH